MNIKDVNLLVISQHYSHFVKDQVDEIANHVNRIDVFVTYNKLGDIGKYIELDFLQQHRSDVRINSDKIPENVHIHKLPLLYLPIKKHKNLLGRQHAYKLQRALEYKQLEFDLIHSHFTWSTGYAGQKISEKYNTSHVLTVHENRDRLMNIYKSSGKSRKYVWENSDTIIRVNKEDMNYITEFNDQTKYIPNGYNNDYFKPINKQEARDELEIPHDSILLFSLGNLIKRKGYQNVIPAIKNIDEDDILYVIGGHGPMKKRLVEIAEENRIGKNVRLPGYLPKEELKYWMSACDLFVHPSYSESFGLVQLEAMACGAPVVAAKNGGSEEVVSKPEYGLLIEDPEDREKVASILTQALEKEWNRDTIIKYANKHTIENICSEIVHIYESVI